MPHIQVFSEVPARDGELDALRLRLAGWSFRPPFALVLTEARLELRKLDEPKLGAVYVDFIEGCGPSPQVRRGRGSPSPRRWG